EQHQGRGQRLRRRPEADPLLHRLRRLPRQDHGHHRRPALSALKNARIALTASAQGAVFVCRLAFFQRMCYDGDNAREERWGRGVLLLSAKHLRAAVFPAAAAAPVVYLCGAGEDVEALRASLADAPPHSLVCVSGFDWERDLSP